MSHLGISFAWPLLLWLLVIPAALLTTELLTRRRRAASGGRPKLLRAEAGARTLQVVPPSSGPVATISTRPSPRLRATPAMPSRSACVRVEARKKTPCTRPVTRKRAVGIGHGALAGLPLAMACSSSRVVTGPMNFFAMLPSGAIRNVVGRPFGAPKSFGGDSSGTFAIG